MYPCISGTTTVAAPEPLTSSFSYFPLRPEARVLALASA